MKSEDMLFGEKMDELEDFNFGRETAMVFDDMLNRSVPLYNELQRMIGEMAAEFAEDGTNIYDLGCSTGNTLLSLYNNINKDVHFIGMDYSEDMLDKCRERLRMENLTKNFEFICTDLNKSIVIENASVIVMNLTLQFIRPLHRDTLMKSIYNGLSKNGCFILVEKVLGNDSAFNRMFIKFYYNMKKRQGYSELEIAQKREALENVLVPYRLDENKQLLLRNGFNNMDIFYKWNNFCGIVAVK